jgi:chromate transporter
MDEPAKAAPSPQTLMELAGLFLKLGATAFGGPAAHIALMEHEVVRRRSWLSKEAFVDLLGATNLIPGPNSTEMAIHIGLKRGGWAGLVVAGSCFILPAAILVTLIAWAYVRYGQLPRAEALMYGIKPVIIAVVLQALWGLGRTAAKTRFLGAAGLIAAVLGFAGVHELLVLFGTGLVVMVVRQIMHKPGAGGSALWLGVAPALPISATAATAAAAAPFGLWPMFLFFVKVGSVLYGSGYVLLAFLRADLVDRWGWLSEGQLLDAIAVGQITPGPVFTTATFIGFLLGGGSGAVLATLGIFLPAFFFVAVSGPLVPRIRRSAAAGAFLDGVNVASLALMAVVTWQLGRVAVVDGVTVLLALASGICLMRFRVNSAWLVLGGGMAGLAAHWLRRGGAF